MRFPDQATANLYYREASPTAPVRRARFAGDMMREWPVTQGFELRLNPAENELRPLLRRVEDGDVFLERLELVMNSDQLASISLHDRVPITARFRLYQHGFQSWSFTTARTHRERDAFVRLAWKHRMDENPETPFQSWLPFRLPGALWPARGRFYSEGLVGLEEIEHSGAPVRMLFSVAGPGRQFVRYRVHLDPRSGRLTEFAVIWDFNGRFFPLHSRESITRLSYRFSNLPEEDGSRKRDRSSFGAFLDETMAGVARAFKGRARNDRGIVGWCSWYYYYTDISEGVILRNLRALKKSDLKIDIFQIDDGYQRALGDWLETNQKFPTGMKYLAREIKAAGFDRGIWLAPTIIQNNCRLARDMPELILKQVESDKAVKALYNPQWGGWAYELDVTHPRYEEWLKHTIHTIVHDWGYNYLKLDFLFAAGLRGRYHVNNRTAAERLHHLFQLIRRVAGKKTFLLGCGAPLWPAIGIMDGMRIGMDTNHFWDHTFLSRLLRDRNFPTARSSLINTIPRSYMHNRFWINDPDCLMVRDERTTLNRAQVLLMASVMAVSGGMLLLSDDLTRLDPDRFRIFSEATRLNRRCAAHTPIPLGLLDHHFPEGLYNPAGFLGVWNARPTPFRLSVEVPPGVDEGALRGARDYWTGQSMPWRVRDGRASISLAPFESMVAVLGG